MPEIIRIMDDLNKLAEFGKLESGGITRQSFSDNYYKAEAWLIGRMNEAGLSTRIDDAGNIRARLGGEGPAVFTGSHIDTVVSGGMYDGSLGVISALECIRVIRERRLELKSPVEIVVFNDEEERFLGFLGSRALCGDISPSELVDVKDKNGIKLLDSFRLSGMDYTKIGNVQLNKGDVKAFIELHIEQGPILEKSGITIGIVDKVLGNYRFLITIKGRSDHAGSPMDFRKDAFASMLEILSDMNLKGQDGTGKTLYTIGYIDVEPNEQTVQPGFVSFTIDIRDPDKRILDKLEDRIYSILEAYSKKTGMEISKQVIMKEQPVYFSEDLQEIIKAAAEDLDITSISISSGAGHDCQVMRRYFPAAMIFVPSIDGRSHCLEENTKEEDILKGTSVLLETLVRCSNI